MMISIEPKYGETHYPGYIGFSYRDNNVFSKGIAVMTKEDVNDAMISHAFLVRDNRLLIEASIHGVIYRLLSDYFDDPHVVVSFKKPLGWDLNKSSLIINRAETHLGCKYDYGLISYFVKRYLLRKLGCDDTLLGRGSLFDNPDKYVCSEFVADALLAVPEYRQHLFKPPCEMDPLALFRSEVFEDWKYDQSNATK